MIPQIDDTRQKNNIARDILYALPEWFSIPRTTETYIRESAVQPMVASLDGDRANGFLCLKQTSRDTVELAVMGVRKELHRRGIGRGLFGAAKAIDVSQGYSFMQVKTVQMGQYEEYDQTNRFYLSLGFKEFECFPTLWDEWNPCQIYVMSLC